MAWVFKIIAGGVSGIFGGGATGAKKIIDSQLDAAREQLNEDLETNEDDRQEALDSNPFRDK